MDRQVLDDDDFRWTSPEGDVAITLPPIGRLPARIVRRLVQDAEGDEIALVFGLLDAAVDVDGYTSTGEQLDQLDLAETVELFTSWVETTGVALVPSRASLDGLGKSSGSSRSQRSTRTR